MNNSEKGLKERRKLLNKSLKLIPGNIQKSMNLHGVQTQTNIFFLGNRTYLKVYSLNLNKEFDDILRQKFVEVLCHTTLYRVRISSFVKRKDNTSNIMRFLTLYIEGVDYAEVHNEFRQEDLNLANALAEIGINVKECSINTILMLIHMNFFNEIRNYDIEDLLYQRENMRTLLFPDFVNQNSSFLLKEPQRFGMAFYGENYTEIFHDANIIGKLGFDIQSCVDIQVMTEEENRLFNYAIKRKYNYKYNMRDIKNVNMTFLLSLQSENEIRMAENVNRLKNIIGTSLYPCMKIQSTIHSSICSFGILDYHKMRNVSESIIGGLVV